MNESCRYHAELLIASKYLLVSFALTILLLMFGFLAYAYDGIMAQVLVYAHTVFLIITLFFAIKSCALYYFWVKYSKLEEKEHDKNRRKRDERTTS